MADALSRPDPCIWRTRPRAPMPGTPLGSLEDIRDGDAKEYVFGRGTTVFSMFVVRRGGMVYGYLNLCPHYSSRLNCREGQFMSEDGSRIRCTMHFAEFRIEDRFGVEGAAKACGSIPFPCMWRMASLSSAIRDRNEKRSFRSTIFRCGRTAPYHRETFEVDTDACAPAFAERTAHVPRIDPAYQFDPATTMAILSGICANGTSSCKDGMAQVNPPISNKSRPGSIGRASASISTAISAGST